MEHPQTFGELKKTSYLSRSVKEEMRENLIDQIKKDQTFAADILGYENTVLPQIRSAILAKHDFILLGLRGQGKSRLLKRLINLLDEYVPYVKGSPIYEDPFAPILNVTKERIKHEGDALEIEWLHRSERFTEKLATPDVSISDLIGDIDPIKASNEQKSLSDPTVIDFGLIPKAHRGIFAINELADLQPRIQVSLFNLMEEKTVQIKGFSEPFHLDLALVYSANPEDYTARGSIITPLKDRIDSQIITHYPLTRELGIHIIKQEVSSVFRENYFNLIPDLMFQLVEQITIEARKSDLIDQSSGVSARLSISAMENIIAFAEHRSILNNEHFNIRITDLYAAIPAITGKIELMYEGEQEGIITIAENLIGLSVRTLFEEMFPINNENSAFFKDVEQIKEWFITHKLEIEDHISNHAFLEQLRCVDHLETLTKHHFEEMFSTERYLASGMQFILEGLVMTTHLSKFRSTGKLSYLDMMGGILG